MYETHHITQAIESIRSVRHEDHPSHLLQQHLAYAEAHLREAALECAGDYAASPRPAAPQCAANTQLGARCRSTGRFVHPGYPGLVCSRHRDPSMSADPDVHRRLIEARAGLDTGSPTETSVEASR